MERKQKKKLDTLLGKLLVAGGIIIAWILLVADFRNFIIGEVSTLTIACFT
jgi:hypothetical protein